MIRYTIRILQWVWNSTCLLPYWCCVFFLLFLLPFSGESRGASLDFIYINSSVDAAAGGHAAVRLDQKVYHFQYHDRGEFLLETELWKEFRFQYNDLQNRTLYLASIPVSQDVFQKISHQFNARYVLQKKRFHQLEQLKDEEDYFRSLVLGEGHLAVPGLGLFSPGSKGDKYATSLKIQLEQLLGEKVGMVKLRLTNEMERAATRIQPVPITWHELDLYRKSMSFPDRVLQYQEIRAFRAAIAVLEQEATVAPESLYQLPLLRPLTEDELTVMKQYQHGLVQSIAQILKGERTASFHALLIQMARYQAVGHSIETRQLTVIDPFSQNCDWLSKEELIGTTVQTHNGEDGEESTFLAQLYSERWQKLEAARQLFFGQQHDSEISYGVMEKAFGELWELHHVGEQKQYARIESGNALPDKTMILNDNPDINAQQLAELLTIAAQNRKKLDELLLKTYSYNLFSKNCVTELFQTVYDSFETEEEAKDALGGYLIPGEKLSYVPFRSFDVVQELFPVDSKEILPSYRIRKAEQLYEEEGAMSLLKESNTLTSTIYTPWDEDTAFLFFTDDVVLFRPLFGVSNLVYAVLGAAGGFFALPFDDGTLLQRSFKGMVFSLPELIFVNIRKGSFPTISERE